MSSEIVSVVVGTAGHIDHGKSSLVRRLTGTDPDRLKEEKERELTIDLGFARFELADGRTVGIIDVPGHERFIKNMVAGASGIDLVMLVVAADDGVMPQTREHLEILTLLGLKHGIVVLTKVELPGIDEELIEVIELELSELLVGTFLEHAPVVRVDSISGAGFDQLKETLTAAIDRCSADGRPDDGAFRLPVQRVFTARGFGTILTGIPLSGALAVGDHVEVITADRAHKSRVRGLQAYGDKVERVRAGHSSAVNVSDVDYKVVNRGDTVAAPGVFSAHALWEARLQLLPSQQRPLKQRETVRLHVGTSEVLGEVVLLDRKTLNPGEAALCQVRLREPLVAAPGDPYVIRRHSPMETLGGGRILNSSRWRLKPFKGFVLERLDKEEATLGDLRARLLLALEQQPLRVPDLVKDLGKPKAEVQTLLDAALADGDVIEVSGGKGQPVYLSAAGFVLTCERIQAGLQAFHTEHPWRDGCPRLELRTRTKLTDGLLANGLAALTEQGHVHEVNATLALTAHQVELSEEASTFVAELLAHYEEQAWTTPTWAQAREALAPEDLPPESLDDLFRNLVDRGELIQVGDELVFHRDRYEASKRLVKEQIEREGPLPAATFKTLIDSSRRYTIPLLEHFDEIGLTRRDGNVRVLR